MAKQTYAMHAQAWKFISAIHTALIPQYFG